MSETVFRHRHPTVGGGRHPRHLRIRLHVVLGERETPQPYTARTRRIPFQLQLDGHLDRREPEQICKICDRLSDQRLIGILHDHNVLRCSSPLDLPFDVHVKGPDRSFVMQYPLEGFGETSALTVALAPDRPTGNQHGASVAARRVVRVLIRPDVHATLARPFNELDGGVTRSPVVGAARLDVRLHRCHTRAFGDLDGFSNGVEECCWTSGGVARQVPHRVRSGCPLVCDVDAVVCRQLAHHREHFLGIAPATGNVLQSRRHAQRPFLHSLAHEGPHVIHFRRGRHSAEIVTHRKPPNSAVADHQRHVGPKPGRPEIACLFGDRPHRPSVLIHHHRRDPLGHEVGSGTAPGVVRAQTGAPAVRPVCVRMHVDEARNHHESLRVDDTPGGRAPETPQGNDLSISDSNVRVKPRISRSVEHAPPTYQHIEGLPLAGRRYGQQPQCDHDDTFPHGDSQL